MKKFVLALLCLSIGACGSLTKKRDEAAIEKVKKVAVVAFDITEPTSAKIGIHLGDKTNTPQYGDSGKTSDHVEQIFKALPEAIKKNLGWTVLDVTKMETNDGYKVAFEKTMTGWQNKMPPPSGAIQYVVPKIMDSDSLRILRYEAREDMINALKVDAVVVARINVNLNGTSIIGIGARHPQAHLTFTVYARGQEKPIWFEGNIEGEEGESVGSTGFIDTGKLETISVASAKSAFDKIKK